MPPAGRVQNPLPSTMSPLAAVPRAIHVLSEMELFTKRTDPSARTTLTPPVCLLRAKFWAR